VLKLLYSMGRMEVLVEGGSRTARAFLDQRLVDRIHFFYAPKILGGASSLSMIGGEGPAHLAEAVQIDDLEVYTVCPDVYVTGKPSWSGVDG
jgi:diaminohydroxyphosphoribosylaminopyrimidine deaminase/5-amino-6-(5-phosphoribosylamino)uracil reductase